MAKKYQAIETKVHWLTWTIIGVIVVALIALTVALQPSAKDTFYDSYLVASQDASFKNKLPKDNKIELVSNLENKLFSKGLISLAERENHLTIVFFGDASNQTSVTALPNVYARLYGSEDTSPVIKPSDLFSTLGDAEMTLYHYSVKDAEAVELAEDLNAVYEGEFKSLTLPTLVVFLNGEVVDSMTLGDANLAVQLYEFYNSVLENSALSELVKK